MKSVDNVYVTVALLLFFGLILGHLAKRIRLPSITGNILAGLLLGPIFRIVDTQSPTIEAQLEPMVIIALSLIAISIGSHLKFHRLRNALRRILAIGFVEMVLVPTIVFSLTFLACRRWEMALFMGILATATAPATVLHVVKEVQARGSFVKTLIAVVVFNNVACLFLFEGARHWVFGEDIHNTLLVVELFGSIALGISVAFLLMFAWQRTTSRKQVVTFSFSALAIAYGLALQLELSPILANLALGITVTNLSERNKILDIFEDFEGIIFTVFFTLMGTHAHFNHLGSVGVIAAIYFSARILANTLSVRLASRVTQFPKKIKRHLPLALTPHAGLTVGLVVSLRFFDIADTIIPVVILAVSLSEIVGPLVLRYALKRSGEEGQAVPRMIGFLQEEYIKVDLKARDRDGVIEELVDFLFRSRPQLKKLNKKAFLKGVLERETRGNTNIAPGLAIPHFTIEEGNKVVGVMGILRDGVEWGAKTVHAVILIATPPGHHKQHLGALSTIAKLFTLQSVYDRGLVLARTAGEAYESLVDEEFDGLNKVLDDDLVEISPENPELAERFRVQALGHPKLGKVRQDILESQPSHPLDRLQA